MTKSRRTHFDLRSARLALVLVVSTAVLIKESQAQVRQPISAKLSVSPSVNISRIDAGLQRSFAEELVHLNESVLGQTGGMDSVSLGAGFSISAYENISVLVSVKTPERARNGERGAGALTITCGYLNDGTTYFRRSTITNKSTIEFRLRSNSLLKRSMKLANPLFQAFVFFLIHERKEAKKYGGPLPVSTVTVEFM